MINFSSHNIQTIHRSGYLPAQNAFNRSASTEKVPNNQEKAVSLYSYAQNITSPTLRYYVSNLAYGMQFTKEPEEKCPVNPDGTVNIKVGYTNDIHGQYVKLEKMSA